MHSVTMMKGKINPDHQYYMWYTGGDKLRPELTLLKVLLAANDDEALAEARRHLPPDGSVVSLANSRGGRLLQ